MIIEKSKNIRIFHFPINNIKRMGCVNATADSKIKDKNNGSDKIEQIKDKKNMRFERLDGRKKSQQAKD